MYFRLNFLLIFIIGLRSIMLNMNLADKGVKFILLGWGGFIAENVIVTHNRDFIISHLGGENFYR